jgi:hypothetical protein
LTAVHTHNIAASDVTIFNANQRMFTLEADCLAPDGACGQRGQERLARGSMVRLPLVETV